MSWSYNFRSQLSARTITARYRLEFLQIPNSIGTSAIVHSQTGDLKLADYSIRIDGTSVTPQSWSVAFGGFSCQLVGDIRKITPWVRRGQFAVLWCSINGSPWERLIVGQLVTITGNRPTWTLRFRDLISAFQNTVRNRAAATANFFNMFWYAGFETTLSSTWNTSDSTMSILNGSIFDAPTTGSGLVKCWADSANLDSFFYLKFTGNTSTSLTGVASVAWPVGSASVGTLDPASNAKIAYLPFLEGVPWSLFGKIITSTGTGSNGSLDVFPSSWSVGGGLVHDIFDFADAKKTREVIKRSDGSSNYSWAFPVETPFSNGLRNYIDISSQSGQWPVQRQGSISWRGCVDPTGHAMGYHPPVIAHIKDQDIQQIIEHDLYSTSVGQVYSESKVSYTNSTTYSDPSVTIQANNYNNLSLPATEEIIHNMVGRYNPTIPDGDKRTQMATGDLRRMKYWDLYPSERLRIRVNLKHAVLCAGDVVEITSQYLSGAYSPRSETFRQQRAMVLKSSIDFGRPSVTLELGITRKE